MLSPKTTGTTEINFWISNNLHVLIFFMTLIPTSYIALLSIPCVPLNRLKTGSFCMILFYFLHKQTPKYFKQVRISLVIHFNFVILWCDYQFVQYGWRLVCKYDMLLSKKTHIVFFPSSKQPPIKVAWPDVLQHGPWPVDISYTDRISRKYRTLFPLSDKWDWVCVRALT